MSGDDDSVGARYRFACSNGYVLATEPVRTCQASLQWSGSTTRCAPVDCGDLSRPTNGQVFFSSTVLNAIATYSCGVGYLHLGPTTRTCTAEGSWTGLRPACILESPATSDLRHVRLTYNGDFIALSGSVQLLSRFSAAVVEQLAASLGVPTERLVLLDIAEGSIAVVFGIRVVSPTDAELLGPDADTLIRTLETLVDLGRIEVSVPNGPVYSAIPKTVRLVDFAADGSDNGGTDVGSSGGGSTGGNLSASGSIAVAIGVVCALLVALIAVLFVRNRRQRRGGMAIQPYSTAVQMHNGSTNKTDQIAAAHRRRESILLGLAMSPSFETPRSGAWGTFDADAIVATAAPVSSTGFVSADLSSDFPPSGHGNGAAGSRGTTKFYLPMHSQQERSMLQESVIDEEDSVLFGATVMGGAGMFPAGGSPFSSSPDRNRNGDRAALAYNPYAVLGEPIVHNSTALSAQGLLHNRPVGSFMFWGSSTAMFLSVKEQRRVRHVAVTRRDGAYCLAHRRDVPLFRSLGDMVRHYQAHPYDRSFTLGQEELLESVF